MSNWSLPEELERVLRRLENGDPWLAFNFLTDHGEAVARDLRLLARLRDRALESSPECAP